MICNESSEVACARGDLASRPSAATVAAVVALLAALLLAVAVPAAAQDAPTEPNPAGTSLPAGFDLHAEADRVAEELGAPGLAVGVVDSTGVRELAYSGVDGNGDPVGQNSAFVWGSVSKSFAALVISELEDQGVLAGDMPVSTILPPLVGTELDRTGVTIDDLVHHTSGLPHQMELTDVSGRTGPAIEVVPAVAEISDVGPMGEYRYSSINYLLLQAVVETAAGSPYADVLDDVLAGTAGVDGVIAGQREFDERITPGHVPYFFGQRPVDVGLDGAGLGYGYLSGTADQLARFASWQVGDLLSSSTSSVSRREGAVDTGSGARYGSGLFLEQRGDDDEVTVARHSGAVPGYFTYLAVSPERDVGVVLMANTYGELRSTEAAAAAEAFADRAMGLGDGQPSGSPLYPGVIIGGIAVLAALVGLLVWVVAGLVQRPSPRRRAISTVVRVSVTAVVGAVVLLGGLMGVPALVGVPFGVASRWAPDVTLIFWLAMALIFLVTAVVVAREIAWNRRFAGVWSDSDEAD